MEKCLSCGKENKNLETIQSRGYLWHVPCAKVFSYDDGTLYVDFPSDGKIEPSTIMSAPNKAFTRRVQGCGVKKYHPKNKVMVGRTRG